MLICHRKQHQLYSYVLCVLTLCILNISENERETEKAPSAIWHEIYKCMLVVIHYHMAICLSFRVNHSYKYSPLAYFVQFDGGHTRKITFSWAFCVFSEIRSIHFCTLEFLSFFLIHHIYSLSGSHSPCRPSLSMFARSLTPAPSFFDERHGSFLRSSSCPVVYQPPPSTISLSWLYKTLSLFPTRNQSINKQLEHQTTKKTSLNIVNIASGAFTGTHLMCCFSVVRSTCNIHISSVQFEWSFFIYYFVFIICITIEAF